MRFIYSFFLLLFVCSCTPRIHNMGYSFKTADINAIKPGIDTKKTVEEKLGTPSMVSLFSPDQKTEKWYYVAKKVERFSFFKEKTLSQKYLEILFNKEGKVQSKTLQEGDYQIIPVQSDETLSGNDTSILRDVFGNFGRYSQKKTTPSR